MIFIYFLEQRWPTSAPKWNKPPQTSSWESDSQALKHVEAHLRMFDCMTSVPNELACAVQVQQGVGDVSGVLQPRLHLLLLHLFPTPWAHPDACFRGWCHPRRGTGVDCGPRGVYELTATARLPARPVPTQPWYNRPRWLTRRNTDGRRRGGEGRGGRQHGLRMFFHYLTEVSSEA